MGFGALIERRVIQDPAWVAWAAGQDAPYGRNTFAGQAVTPELAMQLIAVYGSVRFRSEEMSLLPPQVKRANDTLPLPRWMTQANPELLFSELVGGTISSLDLAGNAYTVVLRNSIGQVAELWPLHPESVQPTREQPGAPIVYYVDGVPFPGEILHIRNLRLAGQVMGLNPIGYARQTVGAGLAQVKFGAKFFDKGTAPTMAVEAPGGPDTIDAAKLKDAIAKFHTGGDNAHGVLVLTGGATAKPLTIALEDAQFLQTKNMTGGEIAAGLYSVPPHFLGYTLASGGELRYQNLEMLWTDLVRRCFQPTLSKIESAISTQLLPQPQTMKFDVSEYLRADTNTLYTVAALGKQAGFMDNDDARILVNLPPKTIDTPAVPPVSLQPPALAAEPQPGAP